MKKYPEDKRKIYYIKKEFQRNFIIKFCLLVILGAVVSGTVIYMVSRGTSTTVFENSRIRIRSTADFILPAVLIGTAATAVLVGFATFFITLYTSHKIAGPLYRIEKDLQKAIEGDLRVKFNLREGDQLQPLASSIESLVATIREDVKELKQVTGELGKGDFKDAGAKLKEIDRKLSKFNV